MNTSLPEGYIENYEEIAADIPWVSTETQELTSLVNLSMQLMGEQYSGRLIDVGCGTGYMLGKLGHENAYGIDISHRNCKRTDAKSRWIRATQGDVQQMPFKSESFDMAICCDVFEHVPNARLLVEEIHRVLRPRGLLFFSCPFEQDLSYYESWKYKRHKKQYRYVHLRSVDQALLGYAFSKWVLLGEHFVTSHMQFQDKPYKIIFQVYARRG